MDPNDANSLRRRRECQSALRIGINLERNIRAAGRFGPLCVANAVTGAHWSGSRPFGTLERRGTGARRDSHEHHSQTKFSERRSVGAEVIAYSIGGAVAGRAGAVAAQVMRLVNLESFAISLPAETLDIWLLRAQSAGSPLAIRPKSQRVTGRIVAQPTPLCFRHATLLPMFFPDFSANSFDQFVSKTWKMER